MKKPLAQRRAARQGDALSNDDDPAGHAPSLPHQPRPSQATALIARDRVEPVVAIRRDTRLDIEKSLPQAQGDLTTRTAGNVP